MSSASVKVSSKVAEILTPAVKSAVAQKTETSQSAVAVPTNNPFYKIVFDPSMDLETKAQEITKLMATPATKEEARELLKLYDQFQEYLQEVRATMAKEIIRLQDTETFSLLQSVMNNLNSKMLEFEKQMQPLTDITEAIYTLRTNGATMDVYRDIVNDKEKEEKLKRDREEIERGFQEIDLRIQVLQNSNAKLGTEKSFWGMGGITKEALQQIAVNELEMQRSQERLGSLAKKAQELENNKGNREETKFAAEKAKLRELLDLTSDEHRGRQQALVKSAMDFIESAKRDIGDVRNHLEKMGTSIDGLLDNNQKVLSVYAIMSQGIEDAQSLNKKKTAELVVPAEGERSIAKMKRENSKRDLDEYITGLDSKITETEKAAADLTTQGDRVKSMKDANTNTVEDTRTLHTRGVAGIADRLSTTLQAVASAALCESSAQAKDTLKNMSALTDKIAQKESIRIALGIQETNKDLEAAMQSLVDYGEIRKESNNIMRAGLADIRTNLSKMKEIASDAQKAIKESFSLASEDSTIPSTEPKKETSIINNPFA